jgi:hypothetical protein
VRNEAEGLAAIVQRVPGDQGDCTFLFACAKHPGNRFAQFGLSDRLHKVRGDSQFLAARRIASMAR